ncbi:MAG: M14 family metallocarboxypeptidase [Clostridia bacterium]|nr:M14 family metallocarboxypeptidase [Clostridia bacterium]
MTEKRNTRRIVGIEPPDSARVRQWVQALKKTYPAWLEVSEMGKSLLGRSIWTLRLHGCGDSSGLSAPDTPVLYCGGVHGREWMTTLLMLYFAEEVLHACRTGRRLCEMDMNRLLSTRSLVIVPCLNPDGTEISINGADSPGLSDYLSEELFTQCRSRAFCRRWKANARGVDINRNFNAGWDEMRAAAMERGISGPQPGGWTGAYPESEPETQAIVALCRQLRFRHVVAFHAQGEEIYWNYRSFTPPRAHLMARILSASSGYRLGEPSANASAAGLKDWFMETYHAPAFTVEIGRGECPLSLGQFWFLYGRLREMLVLGAAL